MKTSYFAYSLLTKSFATKGNHLSPIITTQSTHSRKGGRDTKAIRTKKESK
eukprot:COSAG02_NODE_4309_length_5526_cov_7.101161_4_plen_51_part_00